MRTKYFILLGFEPFFLFFFADSNAQITSNVQISIETSNLSIGSEIKALAKSSSGELEGATITWTHNGAKVLSGRGETSYAFILGKDGKPDTLQLSITSVDGQTYVAKKTVYPGKIHFTWYADTYTPHWYRGKSLITSGMSVTIVAIPEFITGKNTLNSNDLTYTWIIDDRRVPVGAGSGRGKNSYTMTLSSIQNVSYKVGVEIKDDENVFLIKQNIPIEATPSEILFYEKTPLDLVDRTNLSAKIIYVGDSITLEVEPFYTPRKALEDIIFLWKVNQQAVSGGNTNDRTFQLITQPGNLGKQTISVTLKNIKNILQTGTAGLPITILSK